MSWESFGKLVTVAVLVAMVVKGPPGLRLLVLTGLAGIAIVGIFSLII